MPNRLRLIGGEFKEGLLTCSVRSKLTLRFPDEFICDRPSPCSLLIDWPGLLVLSSSTLQLQLDVRE